jgi:short subunit dehydrogenase-like uncharacterized protein
MPGSSITLPLRYAAAAVLGGSQGLSRMLSLASPSVRRRAAAGMRRFFPGSGFGPSGARLEEWTWQVAVDARTATGHFVRVDLEADGHPGYLATATMLGEAGLMLADPTATPQRAGCLTPAAALGTASLDRFRSAGARFSVSS